MSAGRPRRDPPTIVAERVPDYWTDATLVGLAELVAVFDVPRSTLDTWRSRGHLPEPDGVLARRPWWRWSTITAACSTTAPAGAAPETT